MYILYIYIYINLNRSCLQLVRDLLVLSSAFEAYNEEHKHVLAGIIL